MAHQLETRIVQQVGNIAAPACEKIVHTEDFCTRFKQALAKVGADEAGTAGDKNARNIVHRANYP